jgi:Mg2+-importing ATPase
MFPRHARRATIQARTPEPREAEALAELAALSPAEAVAHFASNVAGLSSREAAVRLERDGPNAIDGRGREGWGWALLRAAGNPLVLLLIVLAGLAAATGDQRAASVIGVMVVLGVVFRFLQEHRANAAASRLRAMIRVTATAVRDGVEREVPLRELVAGDIVKLAAGDMVPADLRLLEAKDLYVNQAPLTGESLPSEKSEDPDTRPSVLAHERSSLCFLGTSVQSGAATGIVAATGIGTAFGKVVSSVAGPEPPTAFDRGVNRFTWLMIRLLLVMVPLVFIINGLTKHDWREAFFFAVAVAVGLTPEMLPTIVSVSLSRGAMAMSKKKVIVKHLDAMQNFGAMDVLCTDKTGTLTMDEVLLERHCDLAGRESERVLVHAWLISHFQTGLRNVLDEAILAHRGQHPALTPEVWTKVDEIPFDFSRRVMSVVVQGQGGPRRLIAKGAAEELFKRCTHFERDGVVLPIEAMHLAEVREHYDSLSAEGFRVLAVAGRDVDVKKEYSQSDEDGLVLLGYVGFLDPPKESAKPAIAALQQAGVAVKILTGDNQLVSRTVCRKVGLETGDVVLGTDIDAMSDAALGEALSRSALCARLAPLQKDRIIRVLKAQGHTVGFLGDGINDAPALRAADVGVSVDQGVDIAKESADIILLEKSLLVLHEGVLEGRRTFSNILKYVRMGASSNFGNMLSVLGASAVLPFVPMAPIQILTNNLLYDFSQVTIPSDNVDAEQLAKPRPWAISEITRFILLVGPISSLFDYATYAMMWFLFKANAPEHASLFQTGWFVESLMTQTLIIHVIRTNRLPFVRSRASWPLLASTVLVMAVGAWLPYSPFGGALGFVALPPLYWGALALTLLAYMATTWGVKAFMHRRGWV